MVDLLVLYRGSRVDNLEVVSTCADETLVRDFAARMLGSRQPRTDPILGALDDGKRKALAALLHEGGEQ
jgi:hypothetical protein